MNGEKSYLILKLGEVVNTAFPLFCDAPHLTTSDKKLRNCSRLLNSNLNEWKENHL